MWHANDPESRRTALSGRRVGPRRTWEPDLRSSRHRRAVWARRACRSDARGQTWIAAAPRGIRWRGISVTIGRCIRPAGNLTPHGSCTPDHPRTRAAAAFGEESQIPGDGAPPGGRKPALREVAGTAHPARKRLGVHRTLRKLAVPPQGSAALGNPGGRCAAVFSFRREERSVLPAPSATESVAGVALESPARVRSGVRPGLRPQDQPSRPTHRE